jgi:deoxyadenosine/deoxycytidine kinase
MFRIEVCGGIASGKTTFAKLLASIGISPVHEVFLANPFYKSFYRDPSANAFETEITFLLQHYHDIRNAVSQQESCCCDFSLTLDAAYSDVTLDIRSRNVFRAVYTEVARIVGRPTLLGYLNCDASEEFSRIKRRRRKSESSIRLDYLKAINAALKVRVSSLHRKVRILEIDSGKIDFARSRESRRKVRDMVVNALKS